MIVGEQKPLEEIRAMLEGKKKVLIAGCGTCVTVCFAGGEKEVGILASTLRLANQVEGTEMEVLEQTVKRQCEWEFVDEMAEQIGEADAVLSLACGIGGSGAGDHGGGRPAASPPGGEAPNRLRDLRLGKGEPVNTTLKKLREDMAAAIQAECGEKAS